MSDLFNDAYTVAIVTGAVVFGIVLSSAVFFGLALMWRTRKPWSERRRFRLKRTIGCLLVLYVTACVFNEANRPLPPMIDIGKASVTTTVANRHPLPCIRRFEGSYSDHSGRYVGAYQFMRSTHDSVSNARQARLWPRLPRAEQDRAAWRLYEVRGLTRWSNAVRRNCR